MEENKEASVLLQKKTKKAIVIAIAVIVIALVLLFVLTTVLSSLSKKEEPSTNHNITFYPPYAGNIFEYDHYLGLNRLVHYCADPLGYGLTTSVTEENRDEFSKEVLYLCDLIEKITTGDHAGYNACLNQNYLKKHGRMGEFSQQMLYDITIYYHSAKSEENGDRLVIYKLNYMISQNTGTYRDDVESDAIRPQYIVLRVTKAGEISIEDIFV